jgi:hypothetical protein
MEQSTIGRRFIPCNSQFPKFELQPEKEKGTPMYNARAFSFPRAIAYLIKSIDIGLNIHARKILKVELEVNEHLQT